LNNDHLQQRPQIQGLEGSHCIHVFYVPYTRTFEIRWFFKELPNIGRNVNEEFLTDYKTKILWIIENTKNNQKIALLLTKHISLVEVEKSQSNYNDGNRRGKIISEEMLLFVIQGWEKWCDHFKNIYGHLHKYFPSLSLTHRLSLSLTHRRTYTQIQTHTLSLTRTIIQTLFLSNKHTHTRIHTQTHTHTNTKGQARSDQMLTKICQYFGLCTSEYVSSLSFL